MAESLAERLKRIAAEKKAAREAEQAAAPEPEVTSNDRPPVLHRSEEGVRVTESEGSSDGSGEASGRVVASQVPESDTGKGAGQYSLAEIPVETPGTELDSFVSKSGTSSDHPLAMQFAELEQLLLARDPEFKVILRQVHRHLGQDAELVTQMTEEEISLVVTGLVLFANTEIVEVAKAKSVKKAVAEAKKKVISADDL